MKTTHQLLALCVFPWLLCGCVIAIDADDNDDADGWRERQATNRERLAALVIGAPRATVESEFGPPDFVESFLRDGVEYRVLRYRTHHRHSDGDTTEDETTPLVFVDGELVGWGETAVRLTSVTR